MTKYYTKDHEWINIEGGIATLGITQHAADALGELVYVELPEAGNKLSKGDAAIVVESSKSASDVYAAVSGEVIEVNDSLVDNPEIVNSSAHEDGWLVKIKVDDDSALSEYMDESGYEQYLKENN